MPRHMEAWMDGVALSTLGPVLIQQVYENNPDMNEITGEIPGRYGQRLLSHDRQTLTVAIEMAIAERFDLSLRSAIAQEIRKWASGSVLELSNHPGQRLNVVCTSLPVLGEARNYTAVLRAEFTAYDNPFWEDITPVTGSVTGTSGSLTLYVPGTAPYTPVNVTLAPASGTLTSCNVHMDHGGSIAMSGLSVTTALEFKRDYRDCLMIRDGNLSVLSRRSIHSADDLLAIPGSNTFSFSSDVACDVTVSIRGRWL